MKVREYLYSKIITLCFVVIGAIVWGISAYLMGISALILLITEVFLILITILWIIFGYFFERSKIKKLERITEYLPDKYLLGEILHMPFNVVEKKYFDVMKAVSRSAIGAVEKARLEKDEYSDYVEKWIHEIKTPLTACSLVLDSGGEVSKLRYEIKRADNLTETILYYARMRSIEKDTIITSVSAAEIIHNAIKSQMELLIAAGISVEIDGDFKVFTDVKSVGFMLKQLIINCAKYCPGCLIKITANGGKIIVEDNGIGIPSHELSRVAERGYTGTNGRTNSVSTGMGLFLVSGLCEKLNITFSIQSEWQKFTKITLTFNSSCDNSSF